jgi:mevalonate kinase
MSLAQEQTIKQRTETRIEPAIEPAIEPTIEPAAGLDPELSLSVPGKTFLVGEYLALEGGPSLLLATGPRFELKVRYESQTRVSPFAIRSPAGRFLLSRQNLFNGKAISFSDPHAGRGGLGASSAQFALMYAYVVLGAKFFDLREASSGFWRSLLAEYRDCAFSGQGRAPSGADVVAQLVGGVTCFDGVRSTAKRLEWGFPDLGFTLIRTGVKLATHEHLRSEAMRGAPPCEALRACVAKAREAFASRISSLLLEAVRETRAALEGAGLLAAQTKFYLDDLMGSDVGAWAAKGCGAMGADVFLVLHAADQRAPILRWAKERGLEVCGTERDLQSGLRVEQL